MRDTEYVPLSNAVSKQRHKKAGGSEFPVKVE
jgi:hypothetical protein